LAPGGLKRMIGSVTPPAGSRRPLANSPFKPAAAAPRKEFAVDDLVSHDRYGLGRIVGLEGDSAVTVDFRTSAGVMRVKAPYLKLHKL
jgi:hypothetical protein